MWRKHYPPRDDGVSFCGHVDSEPSGRSLKHFGDKWRAGAPCESKADPPLSLTDTKVLAVWVFLINLFFLIVF